MKNQNFEFVDGLIATVVFLGIVAFHVCLYFMFNFDAALGGK